MSERISLIDVGARGGISDRWRPFYGLLDVLAFEPDPSECEKLNSGSYPYSIRFIPAALGERDGQGAKLFICRQPGCSSNLKPNMKLCRKYSYGRAMEVVGEREVTLHRMDTVCGGFKPDAIKIDTQGTELNVLKGAEESLKAALAVELEVEFVPQYQDQPLFADLDSFMRKNGFILRGLRRSFWRTGAEQIHSDGGQIIHGDALYYRPERIDCPKGHIILSAYRQYDLLARLGALESIPPKSIFQRLAGRALSRVSNRRLRRFVDKLRPAEAEDWHDPDFF